jgi:hypothetical protein
LLDAFHEEGISREVVHAFAGALPRTRRLLLQSAEFSDCREHYSMPLFEKLKRSSFFQAMHRTNPKRRKEKCFFLISFHEKDDFCARARARSEGVHKNLKRMLRPCNVRKLQISSETIVVVLVQSWCCSVAAVPLEILEIQWHGSERSSHPQGLQ